MKTAEVILVNENDEVIGKEEKLAAHQSGLLHRAFSVFIFHPNGDMLLQQRALHKYHSGGLWTNACCSHPAPGQDTVQAAVNRLQEEMGFTVPVKKVFDFIYRSSVDNGLTEFEFDHVFVGQYKEAVEFNPAEVMAVAFKSMATIKEELLLSPQAYTSWFQIAFPKIETWWSREFKRLQHK